MAKVKALRPIVVLVLGLAAVSLYAQAESPEESNLVAPPPLMINYEDLPSISARSLVVLPPPSNTGEPSYYRFSDPADDLAPGPWLRFQRPLELGATLGEERTYVLDLRLSSGQILSKTVLIDRKAPGAPEASQDSGLYLTELRISLEAKDASDILYRIYSSEGEARGLGESPAFQTCSPGAELELRLPQGGGATTYRLLAFARDSAGNVGDLSAFVYRLAPEGLAYGSPPLPPGPAFKASALALLPAPKATSLPMSLSLEFQPPPGKKLLVALNPNPEYLRRDDFVPLPSMNGLAHLDFSWPLGWTGNEAVYLGLEDEAGSVEYREEPLAYTLGGAVAVDLPPPPKPSLVRGAAGNPGILSFPSYDGLIAFSLGDADFLPWSGPLSLEPSDDPVRISWYGLDDLGRRSPTQSLSLSVPRAMDRTVLVGLPQGKVTASAVTLASDGPGLVHYEVSTDPNLPPPEPQFASPFLGDPLVLDSPAGKSTSYAIRYRSFDKDGKALDEGGIVGFTVDREAPPPPSLASAPPAYSPEIVSLSWVAPNATIMVAVDVDGKAGEYKALQGPLVLPGSVEGPVRYSLRAYAIDGVGNHSEATAPVDIVVDRAIIYVAASGQASGDGTRSKPFASLDEALDLVASEARLRGAAARTIIWVGGSTVLNASHRLEAKTLSILGGFDPAWKGASGDSRILVGPLPPGQVPLILSKTALRVSNCDLVVPQLGSSLVRVSGGGLALASSSIVASSAGDALLLDLNAARLELSDVVLRLEGASSASAIAAKDSSLALEATTIEAGSKVSYFLGLGLEGGSLRMGTSRISSAASLGSRLLELRKTTVAVDRTTLSIKGSGGFASFGSFAEAPGAFSNCHILLDWEGSATLFSLQGKGPAFYHNSLWASTAKGSLRCFDCGDFVPPIMNNIVAASGEASVFLSSTTAPRSGDLGPNCLSGFKVLVAGALTLRNLAALNEYNGKAALGRFYPSVSEDPLATFGSLPPATFALGPASLCRGSGPLLPGVQKDFGGVDRRTEGNADLGADQGAR